LAVSFAFACCEGRQRGREGNEPSSLTSDPSPAFRYGKTGAEGWGEIWAGLEHLARQVMAGGRIHKTDGKFKRATRLEKADIELIILSFLFSFFSQISSSSKEMLPRLPRRRTTPGLSFVLFRLRRSESKGRRRGILTRSNSSSSLFYTDTCPDRGRILRWTTQHLFRDE